MLPRLVLALAVLAALPASHRRARLLGVRRPHAGARRPLLGRGRRPLLRLQRGCARQRAAHLLGRRDARSRGRGARRPARAAAGGRARRLASVRRHAAAALARCADPRARLRRLDDVAALQPAPRRRLGDRRRAALRVARPARARPHAPSGARDRRPHRHRPLLALAGDPAQPDRLVRARLRGRCDGHRQPAAAAARPAAPARALRRPARARTVASRATWGPACASTTCRTCAARIR